jgi:toxin ParE1/3/4
MQLSRRVRLTTEARYDLRDLLQYTLERWGHEQRDTYRARIQHTLSTLARHPELGRSRDEILPHLRSYAMDSHLIFYLVSEKEIVVLRIMHSAKDVLSSLPADLLGT